MLSYGTISFQLSKKKLIKEACNQRSVKMIIRSIQTKELMDSRLLSIKHLGEMRRNYLTVSNLKENYEFLTSLILTVNF